MKNLYTSCLLAMALIMAAILSGCNGPIGKVKPSTQTVKARFSVDLPSYMEMTSFNVITAENFGDKIDPDIRARFKASAKITEPLYMQTDRIDGKSILAKTVSKGHTVQLSGKYQARLRGERWVITFQDINVSPNIVDHPLSNWSIGRYVFEGSDAEQTLRAATETKRLARIKVEQERKRIAEQNRVVAYKAEQERGRIDSVEKDKTAKLQARLANEKAARQLANTQKRAAEKRTQLVVKAAKEKRDAAALEAKRIAFRKSISGTWEAVTPLMNSQGNVYGYGGVVSRCGLKTNAIKFSLTIPEGDYEASTGTFTIYAATAPHIKKMLEMTIISKMSSQKVVFKTPETLLSCNYTSGNNTRRIYEDYGKPWSGTVKNGKVVLKGGVGTITMQKVGG